LGKKFRERKNLGKELKKWEQTLNLDEKLKSIANIENLSWDPKEWASKWID